MTEKSLLVLELANYLYIYYIQLIFQKMQSGETIAKTNVQFLFPFRMAIIGPMNAGKSVFIKQLFENLETHTDIKQLKKRIIVIFCYNNEASIPMVRNAAKNSSLVEQFVTKFKLPDLKEIDSRYASTGLHTLLIFGSLY